MNRREFIKEVMNSCEDNKLFIDEYIIFCKYQDLVTKTMKEVHRICAANGIKYQMAFGSLLGIIRDGGQIPWDYDIDIIVPFSQREQFIAAMEKDLDKGHYCYCPELSEGCDHVIARITPKGMDSKFLHVDVFFVVNQPNDVSERKKYQKDIVRVTKVFKAKRYNFAQVEAYGKRMWMSMIGYRIIGCMHREEWWFDQYLRLCRRYENEVCDSMCLADVFAAWCDLPAKWIEATMVYQSPIGPVCIPQYYDELLTLMYGDYHQIAPLEERLQEIRNHLKYLKKNCKL